jgi:hypothetical protein
MHATTEQLLSLRDGLPVDAVAAAVEGLPLGARRVLEQYAVADVLALHFAQPLGGLYGLG